MKHFVYILECRDKTLYVGSTTDLTRRLHEHNHLKRGAHYTKIRRPAKLVHREEWKTLGEARTREAEIKSWSRGKKAQFLRGQQFFGILNELEISAPKKDMAKGNNSQRREKKKPKKAKK